MMTEQFKEIIAEQNFEGKTEGLYFDGSKYVSRLYRYSDYDDVKGRFVDYVNQLQKTL